MTVRKPGKDVGRGRELVIADLGELNCEDAEELSGVTKQQVSGDCIGGALFALRSGRHERVLSIGRLAL
jgi:hypothetical protein